MRRQLRRPPWQAARSLTRRQLRALGERHGQAKLHGTLVMPGAFQVLTMEKAA